MAPSNGLATQLPPVTGRATVKCLVHRHEQVSNYGLVTAKLLKIIFQSLFFMDVLTTNACLKSHVV